MRVLAALVVVATACWTDAPLPARPIPSAAPAVPIIGAQYMCQVQVDNAWAPQYPCGFERFYQDGFEGFSLGASVDATWPRVEGALLSVGSRHELVIDNAVYRGDDSERIGEDYGALVRAVLRPDRPGSWVGELEYKDSGGGMRERWPGSRHLAVRYAPWPAGFHGKLF